ncbi:MAG: AraC family transcriptional regulator [Clostridiales bacterium]|nr:AraC family transcriptional regulator [Clostridiales bacterium]
MLFYYQTHVNKKELHVGVSHNLGYSAHFHEYIEILYLISGKYRIKINGILYDIQKGDVAVIFPYNIHEYISVDGSNRELVILVSPNSLPSFSDLVNTSEPVCPITSVQKLGEECCYVLNWLARTRSSTKDILTLRRNLIHIILWSISHSMEFVSAESKKLSITQQIIKYCAENFNREDLTLQMVSDSLGKSKYYISHIFSKGLKISFSAYINNLRINYACYQLLNTSKKIVDIAFESGFSTLRNFNRVFLEVVGMPPGRYRIANLNTRKFNLHNKLISLDD